MYRFQLGSIADLGRAVGNAAELQGLATGMATDSETRSWEELTEALEECR